MSDPTDPAGPPPPSLPPSIPAGAPSGRPSLWQAGLIFLAAGLTAGGACAGFASAGGRGGSDALAFLFIASVPVAAGAFALLVFRLWRRRAREAWPSLAQCLLMAVAGVVLGVGGCGGWAATMDTSALWPIAVALGAAFVIGAAFVVGAGELFLIGIVRLIMRRPGARRRCSRRAS
jgi:hypothetical protein